MVCPKCGNPWALIWMGSITYKDHICSECDTWYHENNDIGRLALCIEDCKNKIKNAEQHP